MATSMKPFSLTRFIQCYLVVVIALAAVAMLKSPPGLFSDSVSGFLVLQSMERGAPFNHTLDVDPDSISVDLSEFTSWWVPGQYLVVWPFNALGLELGTSLILITLLAWGSGLAGYLLLFRALKLATREAWMAIALVMSQPYVLGYARFYHGGDLLQWAFFPWFALAVLRSSNLSWSRIPLVFLLFGSGIFLKSSFLILGSLTLGAFWVNHFRETGYRFPRDLVLHGFKIVLILGSGALALAAYSSLGETPMSQSARTGITLDLQEILFAAAAPVNSLFGLWQIYIPDVESTEWRLGSIATPLIISALVGVGWWVVILRFLRGFETYKILLFVLYSGTILSFALAYTLGIEISFQVRHFRAAGLMLLPGTVALIRQVEWRPIQWIMAGGLGAYCAIAILLFWFPLSRDPDQRPVGPSGFSHIYAGQDLLHALSRIDAELPHGNNLIAVPWPQLALDIRRNRTLNLRKAFPTPQHFAYAMYYGQVDNLIVIIPDEWASDERQRQRLLDAFKEHRHWQSIYPGIDGYVIMHSGSYSGFP